MTPHPTDPPTGGEMDSVAGNSTGRPGKAARRVSCLACRARKVRCGGRVGEQCGNCVARGSSCEWAERRARRRRAGIDGQHADGSAGFTLEGAAKDSNFPRNSSNGIQQNEYRLAHSLLDSSGSLPVPSPPSSALLPFDTSELPQLTPSAFNFLMRCFSLVPQHPRPSASPALASVSAHPLVVASHLLAGAAFAVDGQFGSDPQFDPNSLRNVTQRLGKLMRKLLAIEGVSCNPPTTDRSDSSVSPATLPLSSPLLLSPTTLAVLLTLTAAPRILLKLGQPIAGASFLRSALAMILRLAPQLSTLSADPNEVLPTPGTSAAESWLIKQQWLRVSWSILGLELGRAGIQLPSLLSIDLDKLKDVRLPAPDHIVIRYAPRMFGMVDGMSTSWSTAGSGFSPHSNSSMDFSNFPFDHGSEAMGPPDPTIGELLSPLLIPDSDPLRQFQRAQTLETYITGLATAGPTPLRLISLYLMGMVGEHHHHLANSGLDPLDLFSNDSIPTPALEAARIRKDALLSAFQAVDSALPPELRLANDTGSFPLLSAYSESHWTPASHHGLLQLLESLIWHHTGRLLLSSPPPYSPPDPKWRAWLASPLFAQGSGHAIAISLYARNCLGLLRANDPSVSIILASPLLPCALVHAAWFHITTLHLSPTTSTSTAGVAIEADARVCIDLLAACGWEQTRSAVGGLLRMLAVGGGLGGEVEKVRLGREVGS